MRSRLVKKEVRARGVEWGKTHTFCEVSSVSQSSEENDLPNSFYIRYL